MAVFELTPREKQSMELAKPLTICPGCTPEELKRVEASGYNYIKVLCDMHRRYGSADIRNLVVTP